LAEQTHRGILILRSGLSNAHPVLRNAQLSLDTCGRTPKNLSSKKGGLEKPPSSVTDAFLHSPIFRLRKQVASETARRGIFICSEDP
jgi:hypothetical protein